MGNVSRPPIRDFLPCLEAVEPARRKLKVDVRVKFSDQLQRSSSKPVVLDFKPLRPELHKLGKKFFFDVGPERLSASSFNSLASFASTINLLLHLEPLVEATFGNAKLLAGSILVAAILVVIFENLELSLSRVRSSFAC